jgi:hypothetical protein
VWEWLYAVVVGPGYGNAGVGCWVTWRSVDGSSAVGTVCTGSRGAM